MKKLILLLLALSLILAAFASCDSKINFQTDETSSSSSESTTAEENQSNSTETQTNDITNETVDTSVPEYPEDYNYTIKKIDGKWYMDFDSYVTPPVIVEISHVESFTFSSFDEMYNTLIAAKSLSKTRKIYIINWYDKTENGIEIINFDELYVPVLPSSVDMSAIGWFATNYGGIIADEAWGNGIGRLTYLESSQSFDNEYNGLVTDENNYILTEGDKTVIVEKMPFNDTINVDLYIKQGDRYCYITLCELDESPTDEYFLQFGLEKWQKSE